MYTNPDVDFFVEKLSSMNVSQSDISNYMNYSIKIQNVYDDDSRSKLFNNFMSDLKRNYPVIFNQLQEDIEDLYQRLFTLGC